MLPTLLQPTTDSLGLVFNTPNCICQAPPFSRGKDALFKYRACVKGYIELHCYLFQCLRWCSFFSSMLLDLLVEKKKWKWDEKAGIDSERKPETKEKQESLTHSFQFSMLWRQGLKTDGWGALKAFMRLTGLQVAGWVSLDPPQLHLIVPLLHLFALKAFSSSFNNAICNFHTTCA